MTAGVEREGTDRAERFEAIRERLDAATPGPWEADWLEWEDDGEDAHFTHIVRAPGQDAGNGSSIVCDVGESPRRKTLPDATFIASAPSDIAFLLDALASATAERDALRTAIKLHRQRVMSLGWNIDCRGMQVHGSEWDRDLWASGASSDGGET